jgi:hypothetical protein
MRKKDIAVLYTLSLSLLLAAVPATLAQTETRETAAQVQATQDQKLPDLALDNAGIMHQAGTAALQQKVLMKINTALINGSLSAAEASEWKAKLNKVNEEESWYKSLNKPISQALISKDTSILTEMEGALAPRHKALDAAESALHFDVNESISDALAHNRISSIEAEKYYMRLSQNESHLEDMKANKGDEQSSKVNSDLAKIKSELSRH